MAQIQIIGARVFSTVYLHGRILGPGYYNEQDGRLDKKDFQSMLAYEERQRRLPVEKQDNPPIYKLDYIPLDETPKSPDKKQKADSNVPVDYMSKSMQELRDICDKRGIKYSKKDTVQKLASELSEYDKEALSWTETFADLNKFMPLSDKEKLDYLESIFGLPDGMADDSDEAAKYSSDLVDAVTAYSTQSQSDEVNAKLKEILDYYNS